MPDIKTEAIRKHIENELEDGGHASVARNLIRDISKLKLLSLTTPAAYKATVEQLQRKYKNSPFALSLILALQLERGVSSKANAANNIQELEKLLTASTKTTVTSEPALKHNLRDIQVNVTPVRPDSGLTAIQSQLSTVDISKLTDGEKVQFAADSSALQAVLKYRKSVEDLNALVTEINSTKNFSSDSYEQLTLERSRVWSEMKQALDEAHGLKGSYLSHPELDGYLENMQKISRESPGGYKVTLPSDMSQLKAKAAPSPC
ncbi:MAG: hypothetical protein KME60_13540 [Cyanomargarita calcarea GSE-NOS-MK-12-04C]|jgi:hypothetical protein|uniref:Uncharacterized protein n=1 Tax=Cyanomargarita calcarea GSE-NOS-MK-12-04C TaxID=2839659 RepID=A0A951UT46_9CYAN|nr:hypothetical protein [Cyanomargarita calcarea GSE-NOS-MK-12-04C]